MILALPVVLAWRPLASLRHGAPAGDVAAGSTAAGIWWWTRSPALIVFFSSGLVLGMVQAAVLSYLPIFSIQVLGFDKIGAGLLVACSQAGGAAARLALGAASDRWLVGQRTVWLAVTGALGAGLFVVYAVRPASAPTMAGALAFATGVGAYGWVGVFFVISAEAGGPRQAGLLSGVAYASIVVGLLVGPPAFGLLLEGSDSYAAAWTVFAALSALVTITMLGRGPHDQPDGRVRACRERRDVVEWRGRVAIDITRNRHHGGGESMAEGVRLAADSLRRITSAILKAGGSEDAEATLVAEHLIQANLAGHDSHGVGMMPAYVRHLQAGLVVPNTRAKIVKDDGALLMFDGARGYGRPVAGEAMAAAIARCRQTGVVAMTLANAHHIGRIGAYGELAIGAGLVSLHFVNVTDHRGLVAPFRGTDARFSTNPVCIALPGTDRQPPVLLDMATSSVAMGKIRVARNEGKPAPEGVLIDQNGKPTRDPNVMYSEPHGALLPFGGHKGYALAVVTELLAGALSGGATIQPGNERRGGTVNNMFTMLIDPARMAGLDWFRREIDGFVDYVKASPPADGAAPVLVPGDPERLAREERTRTGIAVDATTWEEVLEAGEKVGLARSAAAGPDQTLISS